MDQKRILKETAEQTDYMHISWGKELGLERGRKLMGLTETSLKRKINQNQS